MPTISKLLILTGAGFTKNFGGFLAGEMWSKIFNHPSIYPHHRIREKLRANFDFEEVYSDVLESGNYNEDERTAFRGAVEHAYRSLDGEITRFDNSHPDFFEPRNMGSKLSFLASQYHGNERSIWFTLNQDIFMERFFGWRATAAPEFERSFYGSRACPAPSPIQLPRPETVTQEWLAQEIARTLQNHVGPAYIKLHGSHSWLSWDGSPGMVLGINKETSIEKEPLLKAYNQLFRSSLFQADMKLLVIGYGFRDRYINTILLQGILEHGLELFVINPKNPRGFRQYLDESIGKQSSGSAKRVWSSIRGYFPYSLKQIFYDNTDTNAWREIKDTIQDAR